MKLKDWIKAARLHKKWTQQQLGDAVGRTKANVGHWEQGKHEPKLELIEAIAQATGYPAPFIGSSQEKFDANVKPAPPGTRAYPVISKIQAGRVKEMACPYEPGDGYAVVYGDDDTSLWAFFLEIEGDSMLPDFTEGDLVLIDPELTPRPGDFVAARNTNQEATFKKYRVRGITESGIDVFELVPLNSDYPVIRSDEHHLSVIGTMVEHRRKFRRGQ